MDINILKDLCDEASLNYDDTKDNALKTYYHGEMVAYSKAILKLTHEAYRPITRKNMHKTH